MPPATSPTWLIAAALGLVMIFCAIVVGLVVTGHHLEEVVTGSMQPTIPIGSMVVTEQLPASELQVGDIMVFPDPNDTKLTIVHRIVWLSHDQSGDVLVRTKGDYNALPDQWTLKRAATAEADRVIEILPGARHGRRLPPDHRLLGSDRSCWSGVIGYYGIRKVRQILTEDDAMRRRRCPGAAGMSYDTLGMIRRGWQDGVATVAPQVSGLADLLEQRLAEATRLGRLDEAGLLSIVDAATQLAADLGAVEIAPALSKRLRRHVYEYLLSLDAVSGADRDEPRRSPRSPEDAGGMLTARRIVRRACRDARPSGSSGHPRRRATAADRFPSHVPLAEPNQKAGGHVPRSPAANEPPEPVYRSPRSPAIRTGIPVHPTRLAYPFAETPGTPFPSSTGGEPGPGGLSPEEAGRAARRRPAGIPAARPSSASTSATRTT